MFISVKHQRQQQEVEFWFPAIGAYQLLQAKETVYHTDDPRSGHFVMLYHLLLEPVKIDSFEPKC